MVPWCRFPDCGGLVRFDPTLQDQRHIMCVHCGGDTETRDHAASKVLLDDPLPPDLPVVPACRTCNGSFSLDEEYLACLVECTVTGSTDPERVSREKVAKILRKHPSLAARIERARTTTPNGAGFSVEIERVRNVIVKLARAHAQFALSEPQLEVPTAVSFSPIGLLQPAVREAFETVPPLSVYPEIGSRAFQDIIVGGGDVSSGECHTWVVLQPGRYRYLVIFDPVVVVRIVLSEFLACEVQWA